MIVSDDYLPVTRFLLCKCGQNLVLYACKRFSWESFPQSWFKEPTHSECNAWVKQYAHWQTLRFVVQTLRYSYRVSNHPDFMWIIPILLEYPDEYNDATSVGIGKSRFWIPESYFRQINKETKYLTWIWVKVKVWTKKTANKNPSLNVCGCIAFMQGLLRLVTSHAFRISGKYQAWKQAWNDNQFTESFLTEIFIWECWKWCFRVSRWRKFRATP